MARQPRPGAACTRSAGLGARPDNASPCCRACRCRTIGDEDGCVDAGARGSEAGAAPPAAPVQPYYPVAPQPVAYPAPPPPATMYAAPSAAAPVAPPAASLPPV